VKVVVRGLSREVRVSEVSVSEVRVSVTGSSESLHSEHCVLETKRGVVSCPA